MQLTHKVKTDCSEAGNRTSQPRGLLMSLRAPTYNETGDTQLQNVLPSVDNSEQKRQVIIRGPDNNLKTSLPDRHLSALTFRHRASCILGQAFHYSPENAFYIFNQQIYFII